MGEQPRLLHQRSQYGYTQRPSEAMQHEPEAVSVDEQRRITKDAQRAATERNMQLVELASGRIGGELEALAQLALPPALASHVRAMRRQVETMRRKAQNPPRL